MKITEALLGEHGVLHAQLAHLEASQYGSPGEVRAQAAMLAAGLASHARVEEELLFARLERHFGPGGGPLGVMNQEHEEIERLLEALQQGPGTVEARDMARRLAALAAGHFGKEEEVLFPMAEQLLDENELLQLGEEWEQRRLPSRSSVPMLRRVNEP